MKRIKCPKCGCRQIQVLDSAPAGVRTSLNLNPLRPFTLLNTKKKEKRISKLKAGVALMTGGASLLLTGLRTKVGVQVVCSRCGHVWEAK